MGLPERIQPGSRITRRAGATVTRALALTEVEAALGDIRRTFELQRLQGDLAARHHAGSHALELDVRLYDEGMHLAAGDPVRVELVLRAVQDQNSWNRRRIQEAFQ